MVEEKHETAHSLASYAVGGAGITVASVAEHAQEWIIILSLLVVFIRLVHDFIRLIRFIRNRS